MTDDEFWTIVDAVKAAAHDDMDQTCELLADRLRSLPAEAVNAFADHFEALDARANDWGLWGAAFVIHRGCGDDTFSDFRATLIAQGRARFEATLADPDSLADLDADRAEALFFEGWQYIPSVVMEERGIERVPAADLSRNTNAEPSGEPWEEADLADRFPRLAAVHGPRHRAIPPPPTHPGVLARIMGWLDRLLGRRGPR